MSASEFQIQASIVEYLYLVTSESSCWFHIPNGEYRRPQTAKRLKMLGVRAGVPDLFYACPVASQFSGLWVEVKSSKGCVSSAQRLFMSALFVAGYAVAVVRSLDEFIDCFQDYNKIVGDACRVKWLQNYQPKFTMSLNDDVFSHAAPA